MNTYLQNYCEELNKVSAKKSIYIRSNKKWVKYKLNIPRKPPRIYEIVIEML